MLAHLHVYFKKERENIDRNEQHLPKQLEVFISQTLQGNSLDRSWFDSLVLWLEKDMASSSKVATIDGWIDWAVLQIHPAHVFAE